MTSTSDWDGTAQAVAEWMNTSHTSSAAILAQATLEQLTAARRQRAEKPDEQQMAKSESSMASEPLTKEAFYRYVRIVMEHEELLNIEDEDEFRTKLITLDTK